MNAKTAPTEVDREAVSSLARDVYQHARLGLAYEDMPLPLQIELDKLDAAATGFLDGYLYRATEIRLRPRPTAISDVIFAPDGSIHPSPAQSTPVAEPGDELPIEPMPRPIVFIIGAILGVVFGYWWAWSALMGVGR